ncbi:oligosaccharide flippase family protein [Singulisphaera sp. PoT]|uniref:oligosaccharide flippase family protein n=1 Tax=Singulisphaera sp. PoT TaxID=3411797 RepID=UPI003BF5180A
MAITTPPSPSLTRQRPKSVRPSPVVRKDPVPRRIASNFAFLSLAEIVCRATSVGVTLSLARRLGLSGYGRIEFAFNIVFWLVLLVRDAFEVIISRELARHPRLIRPLVNHVLAIKGTLSLALFVGLVTMGALTLSTAADRAILILYGLLLLTTAFGLDFVFRGTERMGLVAVSLCIRTLVYACGVWYCVTDASRIVQVPAWLAAGELCGITLVWITYSRQYGIPRPVFGIRFLRVFARRGRSVCLIQIAQTILGSADLVVVCLMSQWADVGRYGAPHRMITAISTFGFIFQQVAFPTLARSWRQTAKAGRETLDTMVRVVMLGLIPIAVGGSVLAEPIIRLLLSNEYQGSGLIFALGIWRAPLLTLAFLYQSTLIAVNLEGVGVRLLLAGAVVAGPLVALLRSAYGLPGASIGILIIGLSLAIAGYSLLARAGRQPAWHHHIGLPLASSIVMVPVCLYLVQWHVLLAVAGGGATYVGSLILMGGLRWEDLQAIRSRRKKPATEPVVACVANAH